MGVLFGACPVVCCAALRRRVVCSESVGRRQRHMTPFDQVRGGAVVVVGCVAVVVSRLDHGEGVAGALTIR